MGSNAPVLNQTVLPRKRLKRKYRRNCGAIPRNWSGKPGFCVPGTQKCALIGLKKVNGYALPLVFTPVLTRLFSRFML
jgi:hypothetical protein